MTRRPGPAARIAILAVAVATALTGLGTVGTTATADAATTAARPGAVTMNIETGADRTMPRAKTRERGKVRQVADGDTLWVQLRGKGVPGAKRHKKRPRWTSVRLSAVQATETKHVNQRGSRNWCHGVPAKKALRKLVKGKQVQLRSLRKSSRASGNRLQRHVFVKRGGRWVDVADLLLARGLVMAHAMKPEFSSNVRYGRIMQEAMARGKNMWDTDKCGSGPQQDVPLQMWIAWDAPGLDDQNLNGEYALIRNLSSTQTLSLAGWKLRDSSLSMFRFPTWASIPPGGHVRVNSGSGTHSANRFFWGASNAVWQNPDSQGYADTGVLLDPHDDFRAHFSYPCYSGCSDPLTGKLVITEVQYDAPGDDHRNPNGEFLRVRNVSNGPLDLGGYHVQRGEFVKLEFRPNQRLGAGRTITVRMGKGTDTDEQMHFQEAQGSLNNSGSTVSLANWNGVRVDCSAWGRGRC